MRNPARIVILVLALLTLAVVFLFQEFSYIALLSSLFGLDVRSFPPNAIFVVNKTIRLIVNDLACMAMIFVIFRGRVYLRMSLYVFLFELIILLPAYFAVKLTLEGDSEISSPLLSQFHRLIVNPTLMILLMAGFFYQRFRAGRFTRKS